MNLKDEPLPFLSLYCEYFANKEASESEYWLLLLKELHPNVAEISPFLIEAGEIVRIFDKIRATMRTKAMQ